MSTKNISYCEIENFSFLHNISRKFKEIWEKMSDKEKVAFMNKRIEKEAAKDEESDYFFYKDE